jgi:hypothetical protein
MGMKLLEQVHSIAIGSSSLLFDNFQNLPFAVRLAVASNQ